MVQYEKKPLKDIIKKVEEGDRDAKVALGMLHELGLVTDAKIEDALKLFEEAAKAGDPIAAVSAAEIYLRGRDGIKVDKKKADEFYEIAKSLGFSRPEERVPDQNSAHQTTDAIFGRKVLIIDKPSQYTQQMKTELSSSGCKPMEVHDLRELAKVLTHNQDIECFLVDIEMASPNHTQVLAAIRKLKSYKSTPIVVVTEITDINLIKKAKAYGVNGWILKPIKENLISESVKRLVS